MESAKKLSMGEKVVRSFKKLGEDRIFHHDCALLWTQFKSNLNGHCSIFWPSLFLIISPMMWLYLAEEKNCNCLGHFLGIHGDCSTSVREEFHPNPLQIHIQIYNTVFFNHRSLFRYANSSTLHSYGCLWVSEWAEFGEIGACFYIENGFFLLTKVHVFGVN